MLMTDPENRYRLISQINEAGAEAEARREQPEPEAPREINGRRGPDPVRYGD